MSAEDDIRELLQLVQDQARTIARQHQEMQVMRRMLDDLWPIKPGSSGSGDASEFAVIKVGGLEGTKTVQCSFTYDVYDKTGVTILGSAIAMTGNGQRVVKAKMTEGTRGRGYINSVGVPVLTWVDERITQRNC